PAPNRFRTSSTSSSTFSVVRRPTTTLNTRRVAASRATWSHWSPRNRSAAAAPSQCFSFLPTKAHFSSSWTLVVEGGKAHQLVVEPAGVVAGEQAEAADGVLADAGQAGGLADAAAVCEVGEDGQELVARQAGAEQGRALALGEAGLAGGAVEEAV